MTKTLLLWQIKQKILYRDKKAICLLLLVWAAVLFLFVSALFNKEEKVRIFLDDQDHSSLGQAFRQTASQKISVEPGETAEALAAVKNYQAELLLVIPDGAEKRLLAGETDGIFQLYYLKDNALAQLLSDRLISSALAEVYRLRGEYLAGDLYEKYVLARPVSPVQPTGKAEWLAVFRREIKEMQQKMRPGYYFSIMDEWSPEKSQPETEQSAAEKIHKAEQENQAAKPRAAAEETGLEKTGELEKKKIEEAEKIGETGNLSAVQENMDKKNSQNWNEAVTAWAILLVTGGVNFVFLLYFGLKLLYLRDKNDKMKAAGFELRHQLFSDLGVLLWPEALLLAVLWPVAYVFGGLALWLGLALLAAAAIGFNLLLIRIVKEKQMYFPIGIGAYILAALTGIAVFLQ